MAIRVTLAMTKIKLRTAGADIIQVLLIIAVIMEAIITVGDHIITDSQEIIMI
jgi:hypothetical protein